MIQGLAELVTDRVLPVFDRGVWLAGFRRVAVLPDVLGAAPAPTAPGRLLSVSQGRGGWSGGLWQDAEPLPAGQESLLPGPGPADLQDALPGVACQPGGQRP